MQRTVMVGGLILALLATLMAAPAMTDEDRLKKGDALFAQRANTALYRQAMYEYEIHYTKNKPDYEKAIFLVRGYYYLGERYGRDNPKQAIQAYNLSVKWAQYALELKPGDYEASFYEILCKQRAGVLKTEVQADEEFKLAKERLEKLIEKHPDKPLGLRALGELYRIAKEWPVGYRDYDESEKFLQKAFKLVPDDPETAFQYAQTMIAKKKYAEARNLLISLVQLKGDPNWQAETDWYKQEAKKLLASIRGKI